MKKLLVGLTLLASISSFATSFTGEGETTEIGTEQCGMEILNGKNDGLILKIHGLGLYVETKVNNDSTNFDITTKSSEEPVSTVRVFGKLDGAKPISFYIESSEEMLDDKGGIEIFKDSMNCNF